LLLENNRKKMRQYRSSKVLDLNITLVCIISNINKAEISLDYEGEKMVICSFFLLFIIYLRCVFCHFILFCRLTMEQTDVTATTNSLTLDNDRTMELRKSQINLLSGTVDDPNFYLNEVEIFVLFIEEILIIEKKIRLFHYVLYVNVSKVLNGYRT
jgi:hypothetical protein